MTVVVGFVGSDGAVLASDSEATEGHGGHTRFDVEKCWCSGNLVFGYTGNTAVKQPLQVAVKSATAKHFGTQTEIDRWQAREALCQAIQPVLQHAYQNFVPAQAGQTPAHVLAGAVLSVGRDKDGYWLLEIDHNNTPTFYTDQAFHAVGSGSPAAQVAHGLMSHYEVSGRTVRDLRAVAYRTVDTCIRVLGGPMGVGGRVRLWSSQDDGAFSRTPDDECVRIANAVEQWTTIERESLDRIRLSTESPEGRQPQPVELPEALAE
jgi:proteasome beta subunit